MKSFALYIIGGNNHHIYTLTFLYTFLINNQWFIDENHKIIIALNTSIDEYNKKLYLKLYHNIDFVNPIFMYKSLKDNFFKAVNRKDTFYVGEFNKLFIFELSQIYDKVLYIDSDMLCISSMQNYFYNDIIIGGCPDFLLYKYDNIYDDLITSYEHNVRGKKYYFNGGFLICDKQVTNYINYNVINDFILHELEQLLYNANDLNPIECNTSINPFLYRPVHNIGEFSNQDFINLLLYFKIDQSLITTLNINCMGYISDVTKKRYNVNYNNKYNEEEYDIFIDEISKYGVLHYINKPCLSNNINIFEICHLFWYKNFYECSTKIF